MVTIPVIARRELNAYFLSPIAYVVLTLFALANGLLFLDALGSPVAGGTLPIDSSVIASWCIRAAAYLLMFFVPVVTMRLLSEEASGGTVETLLTAPVSAADVAVGKYLGALIFGMAMLVPVLAECMFLAGLGGMDYGVLASALLGVYLMMALFLAVGLFCSSLTRSQVASALMGIVLLLGLQLAGGVARGESALERAIRFASPLSHARDMLDGVISSADLVYFFAATWLFVFLAALGLHAQRLKGMFAGHGRAGRWKMLSRVMGAFGLLGAVGAGIAGDVASRAAAGTGSLGAAFTVLWWGGLAVAAICAVLNYDAAVSLVRRRQASAGFGLVATALLAFALAVLVCYVGTRRFSRVDMTGKRLYSLSPRTQRMLRALKQPVRVTVVRYDLRDPLHTRAMTQAEALLRGFESLTANVRVERLTLGDAGKLRALEGRIGAIPGPCFVFERGTARDVVPVSELVGQPQWGGQTPRFLGESAFASALASITTEERQAVYFLTGHGERPMEGQPAPGGGPTALRSSESRSLSVLARRLENDNFRCENLNLALAGSVPTDCSVLVIADPQVNLRDEEVQAVGRYLDERAGSVIILIDSRAGTREKMVNVDELLGPYGVRVDQDVLCMCIVDDENRKAAVVTGNGFAGHPIAADMQGHVVVLEQCAPVEVTDVLPRAGLTAQALMTAVETCWGERDVTEDPSGARYTPPAEGRAGDVRPLTVAAVVQHASGPGPTILVVGSSFSFVNEVVKYYERNLDILVSAVNWMGGRKQMVGIPPKDMAVGLASVTAAQVRIARWIFLLLMPGAFAVLGVGVWLVRRR